MTAAWWNAPPGSREEFFAFEALGPIEKLTALLFLSTACRGREVARA